MWSCSKMRNYYFYCYYWITVMEMVSISTMYHLSHAELHSCRCWWDVLLQTQFWLTGISLLLSERFTLLNANSTPKNSRLFLNCLYLCWSQEGAAHTWHWSSFSFSCKVLTTTRAPKSSNRTTSHKSFFEHLGLGWLFLLKQDRRNEYACMQSF